MSDFAFVRNVSGDWHVGYGRSRWSEAPDGPAFYAPDFFLSDEKPWLNFEKVETWPERIWKAHTYQRYPQKLIAMFEAPDRARFFARTRELLNQIANHELEKAVPVEFECATEFSRPDWHAMLKSLSGVAEQYPYGFWTEREAILGVTPEVLFASNGSYLNTMALAGTAKISAPSLLESDKDLHEHDLVIRDIHSRLAKFGEVMVGGTIERVLPNLKHLYTPIRVQLASNYEFNEVIRSLHPTAALGGYPREAAAAWLKAQPEASLRRRFGAPFGYFDGENAFIVVAIRNLQLHSGRLWLGSGCGVVKGSDPEREWEELRLKRDTIRRQLEIL